MHGLILIYGSKRPLVFETNEFLVHDGSVYPVDEKFQEMSFHGFYTKKFETDMNARFL